MYTHTHTHTYIYFIYNKTMDCMIKPSNGRVQIQEQLQILINERLIKRFNEERNTDHFTGLEMVLAI